MRACLCGWHSDGECLPADARHLQVAFLWNGSRHDAPRHSDVGCLPSGSTHQPPAVGLSLQRKPPSSSDCSSASLRLLHGARPWPTQGACSSLRVALRWRVLAPRQQASAGGFVFATEAAIKLRLVIEQDCGCSTVRGGGRLKVRARLGRWHSDGECCFVFATEAAIKLRLVIEQDCGCSTVRGGGRLKVRARLGRWHSDGECLPLVVRHQGPAGGIVFATEAAMKLRLIAQAMKLRLIKQACGCFTVGGGGRLKVRAGLCGWHSGGECLP